MEACINISQEPTSFRPGPRCRRGWPRPPRPRPPRCLASAHISTRKLERVKESEGGSEGDRAREAGKAGGSQKRCCIESQRRQSEAMPYDAMQHRIAQAPSTLFLDSPEAGLPLSCVHHRLLCLRQHQTHTNLLPLSQETAGGHPTPP